MISADISRVLRTGIALSTEKDTNKLLDLIVVEAMEISHADAGTLYLYCPDSDCLDFKIMRNHTLKSYQGSGGEAISIPSVPMTKSNVCSYSALLRKSINISDVENCDEFDFSGPRGYESITGYRAISMMVIPLANTKDELIGVLQLLNAQNENGQIVAFSPELETIITALASQAAMAITNSAYLQDIKALFQSFVQVMITAIDQSSPYNVHHTRRVAKYTDVFSTFLNDCYHRGLYGEHFHRARREQLVMSAWLHDVGKVITPTEIINKATRLGSTESAVMARFDMARATLRIARLENRLDEVQYQDEMQRLLKTLDFVKHLNSTKHLSAEDLEGLEALRHRFYFTVDGEKRLLLTEADLENLSIVQGTLTPMERAAMENHVVLTKKMLDNINFSSELKDVPWFAAMHHECLNGSGYPNGAKGDEIPTEARILTIVDIYEALTSDERPYKKALPPAESLVILRDMAQKGKLDGSLVELFAQCLKELKEV